MMNVTLYKIGQLPVSLSNDGFLLPNPEGYAQVTPEVSQALDCQPRMVDVLATGLDYVAYSIFDDTSETNLAAMDALSALTHQPFRFDVEDEIISGPVLIVKAHS